MADMDRKREAKEKGFTMVIIEIIGGNKVTKKGKIKTNKNRDSDSKRIRERSRKSTVGSGPFRDPNVSGW